MRGGARAGFGIGLEGVPAVRLVPECCWDIENERTKEQNGSHENLLETTQFERGERKRKEKKEKSVHHLLNTKKKLYECDLFEF